MHVDVETAVEIARQTKLLPSRTNVGHGGLCRLLHDVAQFAGQDGLAAIALSPQYGVDHTLYAISYGASVVRSTDGGDTWEWLQSAGEYCASMGYSQQCAYDNVVEIDPTDAQVMYLGGSFNTREFFHGKSEAFLRTVKPAFLIFAFVAPLIMLAPFTSSPILLGIAFVLQYLGLLAERWFFFAQANHPQNLYYQTIG